MISRLTASNTQTMRLFYALWPDQATRAALTAWQAQVQGRKTLADNLHITLAFLGQQPIALLPALKAILKQLPPAELTLVLDRIGYFPRHRIVWAGASALPEALLSLQQTLLQALAQHGMALTDQPGFQPHVTLARDALRPPEIALQPVIWRVRQMVLVQSSTQAQAAFYRVLASR